MLKSLLASSLLALSQLASAQSFPSGPITVVVPFGPGGGTDLLGRAIATELGTRAATPVVVENVPGAGGTIGVQRVMNSKADGHTVALTSGLEFEMLGLANPGSPAKTTDLQALAVFGTQPMVLVARPELGVSTMEQLLQLAKDKPGRISMGAVGPGSVLSLTGLMVEQAAGVDFIEVPYKGAGQILTDLFAQTIDVAVMALPTVLGHIKEGKLVALGVSEAQRTPILPQVPSFAETPALKNINTTISYFLLAPKDTPAQVQAQYRQWSDAILDDKNFQPQLLKLSITPATQADPMSAVARRTAMFEGFKKAVGVQGTRP
jgi:tripartite-type tricarboxylate transporter receptor subunit TctC